MPHIRRRAGDRPFLLLFSTLVLILAGACGPTAPEVPPASYWPTHGWQTDTPENQGLDSAKLADGLLAIRSAQFNLHSLFIARNGKVILDAYFYPYDSDSVHELASVTKSVTTALIAIAADQGALELDQKMVSFFPEREIAYPDAWKESITVRDLAAMRSGLACVSDNNEQTLDEMGLASDWVQFTLDLPMGSKPGTEWVYCSPGTHLLSAILSQATGTTAEDFAQKNLFGPLGIEDEIWDIDPQGYNDGWAGLYMHPADMAKIGYLWLHGGEWDGKQIVSRTWVEQSVKRQSITGLGDDYGYGWWVMPDETGEYSAEGRSGQYIRVLPEVNAVIVTTGGGIEWDQIVPYIQAAVIDLSQPAPANPTGVAHLEAAIRAVAAPPDPQPVGALPPMAGEISGKVFRLGDNPSDLKTVRLDFDDTAEATLTVSFYHQEEKTYRIGLDGVYRLFPGDDYGLPAGMRGTWIDGQTFRLEYDTMANRDAYIYEMTFTPQTVALHVTERARTGVTTFDGAIE
jgi:CubicO group peptidase (beta-lactamase class C family)